MSNLTQYKEAKALITSNKNFLEKIRQLTFDIKKEYSYLKNRCFMCNICQSIYDFEGNIFSNRIKKKRTYNCCLCETMIKQNKLFKLLKSKTKKLNEGLKNLDYLSIYTYSSEIMALRKTFHIYTLYQKLFEKEVKNVKK